ncbi:MAG TPA: ABC transporter permease [Dehalococcoidia bacterium]|jgi:osmoprotectant transport system permease protein|nr:ABC transporter permease [Dehalococcoidia bacterium]
MIRQLVTRDSVAVTGSIIGLASLPLGWLTLKSSRLAAGTSLSLWQVVGWDGTMVMLGLWLIALTLSLTKKTKWQAISLGISANVILIITLALAGFESSRMLEAEETFARVSPSAGIWVTLIASYILVFAARQGLQEAPAWRHLVSWTGLAAIGIMLAIGWLDSLSLVQEFSGREARFQQELVRHISLFAGSVTVGTLIGVPLGIWAVRSRRAEKPIFYLANITQTIPSLALFGLVIAPLSALSFAFPFLREIGIRGVGPAPAFIALVIYSLLPIVRNTFVGLRQLDPAVIDAGLGMGMSRAQVFRRIEAPLAAPLVLEGVRTASVQSVGLTTVAALIGAGGLGWFVFQGLGQAATDLILLGAIPIIGLALVVDTVMRTLVRLSTPKGLGGGEP